MRQHTHRRAVLVLLDERIDVSTWLGMLCKYRSRDAIQLRILADRRKVSPCPEQLL
jgi:hypothetical protein